MRERRPNERDEPRLEMTPMIDVTFLILIFFLCTLQYKTLEGKLAAYLPKEEGVTSIAAIERDKIEVRIDVAVAGIRLAPDGRGPWDGVGRFRFSDDRRLVYRIGPLRTPSLERVRSELVRSYENHPDHPVTIDPRANTVYADVVEVLDAAIEAGFSEITFVGSAE